MAGTVLHRLRMRLADYDGRAATVLGEAEAELGGDARYIDALIALVVEPSGHIANGATWLIKSALEAGRSLSGDQIVRLCEQLPEVDGWAAQLHLCQSMQFLAVPDRTSAAVADWLEPLTSHPRPFLRAWSLDALAHLATDHPVYAPRFRTALAEAEEDSAASVRARARNLRKRGG